MAMKPIRIIKNQYLGVNAHLQSQLQAEGTWDHFHSLHIGDLTKLLAVALYPMGYTALNEESLQIRRIDEPKRFPEADVLILDTDPVRASKPSSRIVGETGELVLAVPELLGIADVQAHPYRSVAIYSENNDSPVAWIEVLSPSNKPGGRHVDAYIDKRKELLENGVVFVEIDFLHEYPTTFPVLPTYRPTAGEAATDAHPYLIAVIDPRPEFWDGEGRVISFDVDTLIPTVSIPLNAGDVLKFDFGVPYQKTFEERIYGTQIDYTQLPVNFDHYREDDQARIVSRMLAVLQAVENGANLGQPPTPVPCLPLQDALKELKNVLKDYGQAKKTANDIK